MRESLKIDFQEGDLTSLHPHELVIYLRGISLGKAIYEGLTRLDENGVVQLAGAESIEHSADRLTYLFHLRKNYWSDGTPVTAKQYEQAWKEALSPFSNCKRADLFYFLKNGAKAKKGSVSLDTVGVKAIDDQTLRVELDRPSPHFLELLAQPICVPLQDPLNKEISAYNGPFLVDRWERRSRLVLKPNPCFWNRCRVKIAQIEIYMVEDLNAAFALYEQKKIDWIGAPFCPLSIEQAQHLKKKNLLLSQPIERGFWVYLNSNCLPLSSTKIRRALSLSINREALTKNILFENDPLYKPIPPALLPHLKERLIQENIPLAIQLFESGLKELGLTRQTFPPLVFTYSQQSQRKQVGEYLQKTWSQIFGIEVKLEAQDWNVLRTQLAEGQFQIAGCFEACYYRDPLELVERLTHLSPSNFSQWVFAPFQKIVQAAAKEPHFKKRMALLSRAEEILVDEMPFIPISSDRFLFAHPPGLKGYAFDSVGAVDFSYATLQ